MAAPEVDVKMYGPLFDGAIYGQMKRAMEEIDDAIADELVEEVQGVDLRTFKHPTGHARSKVAKQRGKGRIVVDRSHLIYGPWLEDGGTRSAIFPGYGAFEKSRRVVDGRVMEIADRIVEGYLIR